MPLFNGFGSLLVGILLVPNLIFALTTRNGFQNKWHNRLVEALEQVGRFGCFFCMIVNLPGLCFGCPSEAAFALYLSAGAVLTALYCLCWAVLFRRPGVFRALALSVLPAALFLCSGVLTRSLPLVFFSLLFAPCHIMLSYQNAK